MRGVWARLAAAWVLAAPFSGAQADVEVFVPRIELSHPDAVIPEPEGPSPRVELGVSSWVPDSLTAPSRLSDAGAFHGTGVPRLALTFLSAPVIRYRHLTMAALAGASFEVLKRSGTYSGDEASFPRTIEESLFLFPLRFGVEAGFEIQGAWSLYGSLAAVPVAGFTTRTLFDDGRAILGLPLEAALGCEWELEALGSFWSGKRIKLGGSATMGRWSSADFSGVGAEAALSFSL